VTRALTRFAVTTPALAVLMLLGPGAGAVMASTNPASAQYGGGPGGVLGETAGGSLPFTGTNLLALLGLGVCMVAAGLAVRRLSGGGTPANPSR
jgi:hypothetical protein